MGRHGGCFTAACGIAAARAGEAPHLLLFPEIPFEEAPWLARVEAAVQQHGSCVLGASEGLRPPDCTFAATAGGRRAFCHAHLGGGAPMPAQRLRPAPPFPWRC